jgi:DeoR/GlpR family transcriptional regulator of sugar metabolism
MFPAERRRKIERLVNEQGTVSITELSEIFSVSEMTIHRDLKALERMGALQKMRGGALASQPYLGPTDYRKRQASYQEEKDIIGRKAIQFIKDGDTIFLGPGTTVLSVARHCRSFRNLTVYTNGPAIVNELATIPGVEVHCTGGMLSKSTMAFVGPDTEHVISLLRPDKCFVGAHGFTLENGVTDALPLEASSKRRIVEVTQEVYLVVTADKFGHVAQHVAVPLEAIDVVITHAEVPEQYLEQLCHCDVRCVIANGT